MSSGDGRAIALVGSVFIGALLLSSCFAWFDFGVEWRDGSFVMAWLDVHESMSLCYQDGPHSYHPLVGPRVFSVGSDSRYVVAQQHPEGAPTLTKYFIVDKARDYTKAIENGAILGPLTEQEFAAKVSELNLPVFTKTIKAP